MARLSPIPKKEMIELTGVSKSYDSLTSYAVENISFNVKQGEFLCLIGESGCGKTTTLKMINRLINASSGEIKVAGENVLTQNPETLRRSIGYVFQGVGLFPHRTVEQNVTTVPELLQWDSQRISDRCDEVLDMVGLTRSKFGSRSPAELSGGQQQRVGFARALAAEPKALLMDEPFGALDPITRAELQDEFKRIQQQLGLTVIMVTHDMTEALLLADRIAVMKDGSILQIGAPRELLSNPQHDYVSEIVEMPMRRADQLENLMH